MKAKALKAVLAASLAAVATSALATDIRFDGFASFVAGQVLNKDDLKDPTTGEYGNFRGFDENLDFQQNSLFALQARADLKDNLSATVQVVAKGKDDYNAKFNWAYLTYDINSEWTAKLGRQRIPYFIYSDFLDVGYAYPWIAPPTYVYYFHGFDSNDGISLEYQTDLGNWTSRLSLMWGRAKTQLTVNGTTSDSNVKNLGLIAWSMNYDWLTLRATYAQSFLTIDTSSAVDDIYQQFANAGLTLSDASRTNFLIDNDKATFKGVGISIDPGQYFVVSELTQLDVPNSILQNPATQWYVSGGYRMDKFTFYATYEHVTSDYNKRGVANVVAENITPLPISDAQKAALAEGIRQVFDNPNLPKAKSYTVGLRYNFHPSACAKLEFMQEDNQQTDNKPQAIALAIQLVY